MGHGSCRSQSLGRSRGSGRSYSSGPVEVGANGQESAGRPEAHIMVLAVSRSSSNQG